MTRFFDVQCNHGLIHLLLSFTTTGSGQTHKEQSGPKPGGFWQYRDWRIGFLSVFHVLYESWAALNPESANDTGVDEEDEWMNTMDIQLVYRCVF